MRFHHLAQLVFVALVMIVGLLATVGILFLPSSALAQTDLVTFPAVGPYNGFLNQTNVYECLNSGAKPVEVQLELFRNSGERLGSTKRTVGASGGSEHFILNELRDSSGRGIADDYGVVVVSTPNDPTPLLTCLPAFYRLSAGNEVEYAYTVPLTNPTTTNSFGIYNSFDPSGRNEQLTDNWLTIFNPHPTKVFTGTVKTFESESGAIQTTTQSVTLQPYQRYDLYLGTADRQSTGIYEIIPGAGTSGYKAFLNRYQADAQRSGYRFAFSLAANSAKCGEQLNASTMGNAHNWLEMANPTNVAAPVTVEIRDRNGAVLNSQTATVAPYTQHHIYLNQYIDPDNRGNVGTVRVQCSSAQQKLLVQSAFYGRPSIDSQTIDWAYVSQSKGAVYASSGTVVVGSVNTFLNAANWAKIVNSTGVNTSLAFFGLSSAGTSTFQQSLSLPSRGGLDMGIHELVGPNHTGSLLLFSTTPESSYSGEILRVFMNTSGGIDYIMPTPLVAITTGLEAPIDDLRPVARSQSVTVIEKGAVDITLSATDPAGKPLTYRLISTPTHGSVTGTLPRVRYTAAMARGVEQFQFVANNGRFNSLPATVSISVQSTTIQFAGNSTSLKPYRSSLSANEVQHLLSKATWGSPALSTYAKTRTLDEVIDQMLQGYGSTASESTALALADEMKDPTATTKVVADDGTKASFNTPEKWEWNFNALRNYWFHHVRYGNALQEKMAFVLHDQFALNMTQINSHSGFHQFMKQHLDLLRLHALSSPDGNGAPRGFDKLALSMTGDGAMLLWLDNWLNSHSTPNQNFAREVMELFTLGAKDPITGLAHYGEQDIAGAARAVSGWKLNSTAALRTFSNTTYGNITANITSYSPAFDPFRWMPNPNQPQDIEVFLGQPAYIKSGLNYQSFLNHILYVHKGAPRYIASRVFSAFVHPQPTEAIISELATDLVNSQYDLRVILRKILKSEAMFSTAGTEGCILAPFDAFARLMRSLDLPLEKHTNADMYADLRTASLSVGHAPFAPPTVFGWKGCIGPRNGATYRGQSWLVAQLLLERERQVTVILNRLNDLVTLNRFRWNSLLPPLAGLAQPYSNSLPEATVDSIATKLGLRLTSAERAIYVRYLTTVKVNSAATPYAVRNLWDPANTVGFNQVVAQKLPGLLQLMFNSTDYNIE